MAKKILIIDDEYDLVETLTFRLESSGYEVLAAHDGEDGLKKVKELKPDIILLDVMMPRIDGYKVCAKLKSDDNYKSIPIIMLTAKGQESDRERGMGMGADDYLTKPFESAELLEKIKKYLGE